MKFLIVTNAPTLLKKGKYYGYGPYVREMNLWAKNKEVAICSPYEYDKELLLDEFEFNFKIFKLVPFSVNSFMNCLKTLIILPINCFIILRSMLWANHIHLRCPGNVGLLGCLVQILFPLKPKTAKYAGNWDPKSKQPSTYKFQKWLLSNAFLTKKMKVLVYGDWPNQTKNIIPFFTASYHESEIEYVPEKELTQEIKFVFVGGLTIGKQPLLSVKTIHELIKKRYNVRLDMYGDGVMRNEIESYIKVHQLENYIVLHGNVNKEKVKEAYKTSHFLIFISKSEGWPKVVAESMFWSCLPITSKVSCVPYMLGDNTRGAIIKPNIKYAVEAIEKYIDNQALYQHHVLNAQNWSREYTLEKFEQEIEKMI